MWNNNPNNKRGGWGQQPTQYGGWGQPGGYNAYSGPVSVAQRSSLVAKVMTFTFFSILAAMAGVFVGANLGLNFGRGSWLIFMIVEIGLIFATYAMRDRTPINFFLLYGFAAVTGISISPVISLLLRTGNGDIVYQALGITAGLTLALSAYAWTTKRDFSGFAPYLFVAVIALVLIGLLNGLLFHSQLLYMAYLYAGTVIFSFYLIFDVQRVKKVPDTIGNAIVLTINIYLDILNLFLFILQLLMSSRD